MIKAQFKHKARQSKEQLSKRIEQNFSELKNDAKSLQKQFASFMNKASHCFDKKDDSKKLSRNPEEPLSVFKAEVVFNLDKILNLIEQEK